MIQVVCSGYRDSDNNIIKCGKVLGEKEGGEGISHTYCDDCFREQMEVMLHFTNAMSLNLANGTGDFGEGEAAKDYREDQVRLVKILYGED